MNKNHQRQAYDSVKNELDDVLKMFGQETNRKRVIKRLSHILDIIATSQLSSNKKAKLVEKVEAINQKLGQRLTPIKQCKGACKSHQKSSQSQHKSNTSSVTKTKRFSGKISPQKRSTQDPIRIDIDHATTVNQQYSPIKNDYQLRTLEIRNKILEQQVQILKARIQRTRDSTQYDNVDLVATLQSQLREAYKKQQQLILKINDMSQQIIQKDAKIEDLSYNNEKLSKLLKVKEQQAKSSHQKHEYDRRQLLQKLDRMKRYELQAKAFEATKDKIAEKSDNTELKDIIKRYKALIK